MSYFGVGACRRAFPPLRFPVGSRVLISAGLPAMNVPAALQGTLPVHHTSTSHHQRWYAGTVVQQWYRDTSFTGYHAPYLVEMDADLALDSDPMVLISYDSDRWIRSLKQNEYGLKRKRALTAALYGYRRHRRDESCFFQCGSHNPATQDRIENNTLWLDTVWSARSPGDVVSAFTKMQSWTENDANPHKPDSDRLRAANMVAILLHAGGIPVVLSTMQRHIDNSVVQSTGCLFLKAVGRRNHDNMEELFQADGISAILLALKRHTESIPVQKAATQALAQVAWLECGEQGILSGGGVPILVATIRAHLRQAAILQEACAVLLFLSLRAGNRPLLIQQGGRIAASMALNEHHNDPCLEKLARALLMNLSTSQEQLRGPRPLPPQSPRLRGPRPLPPQSSRLQLKQVGLVPPPPPPPPRPKVPLGPPAPLSQPTQAQRPPLLTKENRIRTSQRQRQREDDVAAMRRGVC